MSPYVRTVKTASGATAVQFVSSSRRGTRDIEHIGSAHDGAGLEVLKAVAWQRLAARGTSSTLACPAPDDRRPPVVPLPVTSSRMAHLRDVLSRACKVLGSGKAPPHPSGPSSVRINLDLSEGLMAAAGVRAGWFLDLDFRPGV
jgi:hypothetical protein